MVESGVALPPRRPDESNGRERAVKGDFGKSGFDAKVMYIYLFRSTVEEVQIAKTGLI